MFQLILKELREIKNISQKKLADEIGVKQSTVGMWENGKNKPEYKTLLKIADFFNVSVDYLAGGDVVSSYDNSIGIKIPVLGRVAAGIPIEAIEYIIDYEEITNEMASKGTYIGLQIKGDSMEPRIKEGDTVIVKRQSDVESGEVAVILVNGHDATVKVVRKHENGISLIPYNAAYAPKFYTNDEIESLPIEVFGKVVELRGKF